MDVKCDNLTTVIGPNKLTTLATIDMPSQKKHKIDFLTRVDNMLLDCMPTEVTRTWRSVVVGVGRRFGVVVTSFVALIFLRRSYIVMPGTGRGGASRQDEAAGGGVREEDAEDGGGVGVGAGERRADGRRDGAPEGRGGRQTARPVRRPRRPRRVAARPAAAAVRRRDGARPARTRDDTAQPADVPGQCSKRKQEG